MDPFEPTPQEPYTPSPKRPSRIAEKMGYTRPEPTDEPQDEVRRRREPQPPRRNGGKSGKTMVWLIVVVAVVIIAAGVLVFSYMKKQSDAQSKIEQLELANQQLALQNEYAALDTEFQGYENQTRAITDDSVKRALQEKYNAAKLRVEQLLQELNSEKAKSAKQIQQLKDEIATLKGILRH